MAASLAVRTSRWDNRSANKNGSDVSGALTPRSEPDPYEGGAMNQPTRPPLTLSTVEMKPGEAIEVYKFRRQQVWARERADYLRAGPMGRAVDSDGNPLYAINNAGHWWRTKPLRMSARDAVMRRDGNKCVKCGATERLEVDHIVRYIDGGSNELDNLRTLCQPCHSARGGKAEL